MAHVLVVDDEAPLRELLRRGLELDGHTVTVAEDGAEALERLVGGLEIDLLLTDIRMPVMDGIALALAVARDFPDLPILLMTGYADQRERATGLDELIRDVVTKPFTLDEIRAVVRRELAAGREGERAAG